MNSHPTAWQLLSGRVLTVEQHREVDREAVAKFRMNSLVLMENAASECARWLVGRLPQATAVIFCGRGNNGGDGLAIARHLRVLGWQCRIVLLSPAEQLAPDARANFEILSAAGGTEMLLSSAEMLADDLATVNDWIHSADVVLDAMLGTGATGVPRTPFKEWIEVANRSNAFRVAIDIPTGLDATTGVAAEPTFAARATLTFVARKPAMLKQCRELGEVIVLPIGIPEEQIRELLRLETVSR